MPSPAAALKRYKKLFLKLGDPEGVIKLRTITAGTSVYAPDAVSDLSLYKPIVDDPVEREELLVSADRKLFHVWGGALHNAGSITASMAILNKALEPGGGVLYYDKFLTLIDYQRGFSMNGIAMEWFLVTEGIRLIR